MHLPIEWLPAEGQPEQLLLLLHGRGQTGTAMAPLAQALRAEFPQAAILAPDAPRAADGDADDDADDASGTTGTSGASAVEGRQWFSPTGISEANRAQRVAAALTPLLDWVRGQQDRLRVPPVATAIAGFSQGAILALETALASDGLAGRVLAFSGRFAGTPQAAPRHTTVHLFHGGADPVIPARQSRMALEVMGVLQGDATLDIADGVGHALHPALIARALFRLRNHIPARTWAAALGAAPAFDPAQSDTPTPRRTSGAAPAPQRQQLPQKPQRPQRPQCQDD